MIASKCGRKVVEDLHPNWDKIFKEVHNLEDFKLHFFYIDEESPYTPSFFKQIIDTAARK
jgi:thymidine kinase